MVLNYQKPQNQLPDQALKARRSPFCQTPTANLQLKNCKSTNIRNVGEI